MLKRLIPKILFTRKSRTKLMKRVLLFPVCEFRCRFGRKWELNVDPKGKAPMEDLIDLYNKPCGIKIKKRIYKIYIPCGEVVGAQIATSIGVRGVNTAEFCTRFNNNRIIVENFEKGFMIKTFVYFLKKRNYQRQFLFSISGPQSSWLFKECSILLKQGFKRVWSRLSFYKIFLIQEYFQTLILGAIKLDGPRWCRSFLGSTRCWYRYRIKFEKKTNL